MWRCCAHFCCAVRCRLRNGAATDILPPATNLLLLVDQFEELFRYQDYAGREEAEAFAALLLESARQRKFPIYVALTMRSEYLGACALIDGLAEAISTGMYLIPRMSREQCRAAITGPAAVCSFKIEDALTNRLLNDLAAFAPWDDRSNQSQLDRLGRRADQLPLLQYCLNRMWMRARDGAENAPIMLMLADYERIGGLKGALDAHASDILRDLGGGRRGVAEAVFRALTEGSGGKRRGAAADALWRFGGYLQWRRSQRPRRRRRVSRGGLQFPCAGAQSGESQAAHRRHHRGHQS